MLASVAILSHREWVVAGEAFHTNRPIQCKTLLEDILYLTANNCNCDWMSISFVANYHYIYCHAIMLHCHSINFSRYSRPRDYKIMEDESTT